MVSVTARAHRVSDIAAQAGLSRATVDRVLHGRAGRPRGHRRPGRAGDRRARPPAVQVRLSGRTFLVDLVMQAPDRFGAAVRAALEPELPGAAAGGRSAPGSG